jgi:hypothetical protein
VGMSDDKKFCPACKAFTMEPAEGILLTPEEFNRLEPGPLVFEGRMTPFKCPVCSFIGYEPVSGGR